MKFHIRNDDREILFHPLSFFSPSFSHWRAQIHHSSYLVEYGLLSGEARRLLQVPEQVWGHMTRDPESLKSRVWWEGIAWSMTGHIYPLGYTVSPYTVGKCKAKGGPELGLLKHRPRTGPLSMGLKYTNKPKRISVFQLEKHINFHLLLWVYLYIPKFTSPNPQNMTLSGSRVTTDIIC